MLIDVVMYKLDFRVCCLDFYYGIVFVWNNDCVFLYWIFDIYIWNVLIIVLGCVFLCCVVVLIFIICECWVILYVVVWNKKFSFIDGRKFYFEYFECMIMYVYWMGDRSIGFNV